MANSSAHRDFHLIIVAAGSGKRFGEGIPKQYTLINGKALLRHTIENALQWRGLKSLRVVIAGAHKHFYTEAISGLGLRPPLIGGKERNESVFNALRDISNTKNDDVILIHDAARPLTHPEDVQALLDAFTTHRAATLAVPVSDTLRRQTPEQNTGDIVDRKGLWAIQTPQAFIYEDILKAHEEADTAAHVTDDTSLVSALGIPVKLVEGRSSNIKITTKEDMALAEALMKNDTTPHHIAVIPDIRTGTGFDVHAFETAPNTGRKLILCGIEVDHPFALAGHSDADVALHALTDALLGAAGLGDIGLHFPPSDPAFKDMASHLFVEKAVGMIRNKGGQILNLDLTIICEAPKIGPYREQFTASVAKLVDASVDRVNIKATTTEKLGFTGRGEGIAAQASATVFFDNTGVSSP